MKGKTGNLIMTLRIGESIYLDGPGQVIIKEIRKHKVTVLVDAEDETNIEKRESKEVGQIKETAKE